MVEAKTTLTKGGGRLRTLALAAARFLVVVFLPWVALRRARREARVMEVQACRFHVLAGQFNELVLEYRRRLEIATVNEADLMELAGSWRQVTLDLWALVDLLAAVVNADGEEDSADWWKRGRRAE